MSCRSKLVLMMESTLSPIFFSFFFSSLFSFFLLYLSFGLFLSFCYFSLTLSSFFSLSRYHSLPIINYIFLYSLRFVSSSVSLILYTFLFLFYFLSLPLSLLSYSFHSSLSLFLSLYRLFFQFPPTGPCKRPYLLRKQNLFFQIF